MSRSWRSWLVLVVAIVMINTVRGAECPEDPDKCAFAYTNIRLESQTPEEALNHGGSGGGGSLYPGPSPSPVLPPSSPPPDVLLEQAPESSNPFSSASTNPNNPFSSVDLSSFSQEDLEARRELLLSILAQTNAELGVPPTPRAAEVIPDAPIEVTQEDAPSDVVIETEETEETGEEVAEEAAPSKETRSTKEEAGAGADEGSSSFFKNLLGSKTNSATSFSIVAAALTLLVAV